MLQKKICLLGAYGVGKTSLISQFVRGIFSARYLTTVGVKVDQKSVSFGDRSVNLVVWDLAGEDDLTQVRSSYLRGMSGYLLVVDRTRPQTLGVAQALAERVRAELGNLPRVVLLNKSDLVAESRVALAALDGLVNQASEWTRVVETSARTGAGVASTFEHLAQHFLASEPGGAAGPRRESHVPG